MMRKNQNKLFERISIDKKGLYIDHLIKRKFYLTDLDTSNYLYNERLKKLMKMYFDREHILKIYSQTKVPYH